MHSTYREHRNADTHKKSLIHCLSSIFSSWRLFAPCKSIRVKRRKKSFDNYVLFAFCTQSAVLSHEYRSGMTLIRWQGVYRCLSVLSISASECLYTYIAFICIHIKCIYKAYTIHASLSVRSTHLRIIIQFASDFLMRWVICFQWEVSCYFRRMR